MKKILIIDDSVSFLNDLSVILGKYFKIETAGSGIEGIERLKNDAFDAVLLDIEMPKMNGFEALRKLQTEIAPNLPVIVITEYGDVEKAVKAMKLGAYDFFQKDFNIEVLCEKIKKALENRNLKKKLELYQSSVDSRYGRFIFRSEKMQKIDNMITKYAARDIDVLLTGETGVGKDLIAYEIHKRSRRRNEGFFPVPINNFSETLIESELFGSVKGAYNDAVDRRGYLECAEGGTIYFPEISEIPVKIQLKLLEFMQYKIVRRVGDRGYKNPPKVNTRIIMATNENPEQAVAEGKMRRDFYYRITSMSINIPPLRKRIDDIEPICNYFIRQWNAANENEYEISPTAIDVLKTHQWKGNVRELKNVIRKAIFNSEETILGADIFGNILNQFQIADSDYPEILSGKTTDYDTAEKQFKKVYYKEILQRTEGNVTRAAEIAGISRQRLHQIIDELNLR